MTERKAVHADLKALSQAFSVLTSDIEETMGGLAVCAFEPGDVILKEGEAGTSAYVALKGKFSVRKSQWLVLSKEVAQLGPGDLFGEIGFILPTTRSATIVALEKCEAARIVLDDLKKLLDRHPELRARIEEMARRRLYSLSAASQA
ncbi:MAG TPA: hypothetical protein DCZ92_01040 [Elusimicrobia bacterium]|nr:MAG: hypothetical protein A2016_04735 [Elusimicrobia bacterium GWF2_62_30]HBA59412.1 hypothetical protein [Elusimicrobiota bacterium]